jgi:phosphoribosylformylglycinamidine synthase
VEATDLGEFTDTGFLDIRYDGTKVAYLSMDFLHDGLPRMELVARWKPAAAVAAQLPAKTDVTDTLLKLLGRLNICSKETVIRQYDHEVQAGSVVKPLSGVHNDGPSDAAVLRPDLASFKGIAVSNGITPRYSDIDTYAMAACGLDEAVRNAVCVGADPDLMAALDNFCWCDPVQSRDNPDGEYKLAQLIRANQALYDLCRAYGIPLISGKDSMKNDYRIGDVSISIPPTLLVSLVATVPDVRNCATLDFKKAGNPVYLLGKTFRHLGVTEFSLMENLTDTTVPRLADPQAALALYRMLFKAHCSGLVRACHDCSDGGLAVALAEMCFSGSIGTTIDLACVLSEGCTGDAEILFSESPGRIVVEVDKQKASQFETLFAGLPYSCIGTVDASSRIVCRGLGKNNVLDCPVEHARTEWKKTLL